MLFKNSAGAIIFYKKGNKIYYLLLRYPTNLEGREKEYWGFAKGGLEKGEKIKQTVKREVEEETDLKNVQFIKGFKEEEKYFFTSKKEKIFKRVIYLLAEAKTKKVKISREHLDYKWLSYQSAFKKLTFKNARDLLVKANQFLLEKQRYG